MRKSKLPVRNVVLTAFITALVISGCSDRRVGSTPSRPSTTIANHQTLAQRYTRLVSDGNQQLQKLSKQLNDANGNVLAIQSGFHKVSLTYRGVAASVRVLPFPLAMHQDVTDMVTALTKLGDDAAQGAESVTTDEFNLVFSNLAADQKTELAANTRVNNDLGIKAIN